MSKNYIASLVIFARTTT